MSVKSIRVWCMTLDLIEIYCHSWKWLLMCSDHSLFMARPNDKLDHNQKVLSRISQGSMLETETLGILRRKRFICYEKLRASKIVGRVGGEAVSWASRNYFHQESSGELLPLMYLDCDWPWNHWGQEYTVLWSRTQESAATTSLGHWNSILLVSVPPCWPAGNFCLLHFHLQIAHLRASDC